MSTLLRWRLLLGSLVALSLGIAAIPGMAQVSILPEPTPAPGAAIDAVRGELQVALARNAPAPKQAVRVTIGADALRAALARDATSPLIATFITSTEFAEIVRTRPPSRQVTAIYANPDPADQLALTRAIFRNAQIGVVESPPSRALSLLLTKEATSGVTAIRLASGPVTSTFLQAVAGLDAVIVLPDTTVLNQANVNYVVRSLYQQRKVLIGYSDSLTRVGALASVYPRRAAVIDRVVATINDFAASGVMPAPQFVRDIEISVNERLARSLNIVLPDVGELRDYVQRRPLERPQ